MEKANGMTVEQMREQIIQFLEVEGFDGDVEYACAMPDEEVKGYFDSLFTHEELPCKEGSFEF